MAEKRLLTSAELARELGLTARTIQRYRREGMITPEFESVGGHARWDPDKVRQQIRELRNR
jgi:DNA-binding transcriptional MerR regulator